MHLFSGFVGKPVRLDFTHVFLSLFLETAPFLLIGSLLSSTVSLFLSRFLPKNRALGLVLASLLGILFPVCNAPYPVDQEPCQGRPSVVSGCNVHGSRPDRQYFGSAFHLLCIPRHATHGRTQVCKGRNRSLVVGTAVSEEKTTDENQSGEYLWREFTERATAGIPKEGFIRIADKYYWDIYNELYDHPDAHKGRSHRRTQTALHICSELMLPCGSKNFSAQVASRLSTSAACADTFQEAASSTAGPTNWALYSSA